MSHMMSQTVIC